MAAVWTRLADELDADPAFREKMKPFKMFPPKDVVIEPEVEPA